MGPRSITEIRAEQKEAISTFFTVDELYWIEFPETFTSLEGFKTPDFDPRTSFKQKHDGIKIQYLQQNCVRVPRYWYTGIDSEDTEPSVVPDPRFHAEIVSATIIFEKLKDIVGLIRTGISKEDLAVELEYHSAKLLAHRVDTEGDREPDITGMYRNREERMKKQGISCNPEAKLSLSELIAVKNMILDSYRIQIR